ncbi:MAG: hypothetical protein NTV79_11230, partial [Candidatus Aureabacteria bacterium]|nr:hypothetical protein [Candidatus Auribacterota bacterium]
FSARMVESEKAPRLSVVDVMAISCLPGYGAGYHLSTVALKVERAETENRPTKCVSPVNFPDF